MKKPTKPSPDFPLFPHAAGYWAKKIRGRFHYFAPWDQPDEALSLYRKYADDLHGGRITEIPKNWAEKTSVSRKGRNGKPRPKKPYPDFPLFPHAAGQWAKKIKGKAYYFGPWMDPQGSLDKYLAQKDDLFAGRTPRAVTEDGCTVRDLVNRFLASKEQLVASGELSQRSFDDYHKECEKVIAVFGRHRMVEDLTPEDFEDLRAQLAKKLGPVALGNAINRVRILFKYAYDQFLVDKPVRYGQTFKRPSRAVLRKERGKKGPRMLEAKQIRGMLDVASRPMKAMILLGINCGFGNNDCATLPRRALNLRRWQRSRTQWPTRPNRRTNRSPFWCSSRSTARAGRTVANVMRLRVNVASCSRNWGSTAPDWVSMLCGTPFRR